MGDLSTRALYSGSHTYVAPMAAGGYKAGTKNTHDPGRREQQWETAVREGRTDLTFSDWMRRDMWMMPKTAIVPVREEPELLVLEEEREAAVNDTGDVAPSLRDRMRHALKVAGVSQGQAAREMGINPLTFMDWLSSKSAVRASSTSLAVEKWLSGARDISPAQPAVMRTTPEFQQASEPATLSNGELLQLLSSRLSEQHVPPWRAGALAQCTLVSIFNRDGMITVMMQTASGVPIMVTGPDDASTWRRLAEKVSA